MSLSDGLPDYEPSAEDWAELMAAYDEWGGIFPPDEPPELPFGHDFDPAELEDYQPSEADARWHAEQTKGGA